MMRKRGRDSRPPGNLAMVTWPMPRSWMASMAAEISALRRIGSIPIRGMLAPRVLHRISAVD
jgi:hypothetical protein